MTSQSKAMSSKVSRDPKGVWKVKAEPIIRRSQPSELEMLNAPATGTCISPEVEEYIENNLENEREEIKHALISFNLVMKELHDKFSKSRADISADHEPINCLGCSGSTPANNLLISEEVDQQNNFVPPPSPLAKNWIDLMLQLRKNTGQQLIELQAAVREKDKKVINQV